MKLHVLRPDGATEVVELSCGDRLTLLLPSDTAPAMISERALDFHGRRLHIAFVKDARLNPSEKGQDTYCYWPYSPEHSEDKNEGWEYEANAYQDIFEAPSIKAIQRQPDFQGFTNESMSFNSLGGQAHEVVAQFDGDMRVVIGYVKKV